MELFIMKKGIKNRVSSRLTKPVESLTSPEVMIFKLEQTAGENFRWLKQRLFASRKLKVNTFYISITELSISSKELKPSCIKENFEKKGRELTSFGGRIWVREFKSRFLLTSCNFRERRGTAPFSLEAVNPSGS